MIILHPFLFIDGADWCIKVNGHSKIGDNQEIELIGEEI
jgi:hypothetical protein